MNKILLTGTRAYGPARKDSDIDLVLIKKDAIILHDLIDYLGLFIEHNPKPTYHGFYFTIPGLPKINIIVALNEIEFNSWDMTTKILQKIPPIKDRNERIKFFAETRKSFL